MDTAAGDLKTHVAESKPFILNKLPDLVTVLAEPSVKASLDLYRVQLSAQALVRVTGRGQMPWSSDRSSRVGDVMKSAVPDNVRNVGPRQEFIDQVSIFGCDHKCRWYGAERNGIANVRYMHSGSRNVIICTFGAVKIVAAKHNIKIQEKESVLEWAKRVLGAMTPEDVDNIKGKVWSCTQMAGQLLYMPMASFVVEQTVAQQAGDELTAEEKRKCVIVGLRTHFVEPVHDEMPSWNDFKDMVAMQEAQGFHDDKILAFWKTLLGVLKSRLKA